MGLKVLAKGLESLQMLDLAGTLVTDAGMKELAGLERLQMLNLINTAVMDAGVKELAGLKQLWALGLGSTVVTDAGLKSLAGLTELLADPRQDGNHGRRAEGACRPGTVAHLAPELDPGDGRGDHGVGPAQAIAAARPRGDRATAAGVASASTLRECRISHNAARVNEEEDNAVRFVMGCGGKIVRDRTPPGRPVIEVDLRDSRATDEGLKDLAGLKRLRTLVLWNTKVSDRGLKELAGLTELETLDLDETKVTDVGLQLLAEMPRLQRLDIRDTKSTVAGVADLRKALPALPHLRQRGSCRRAGE